MRYAGRSSTRRSAIGGTVANESRSLAKGRPAAVAAAAAAVAAMIGAAGSGAPSALLPRRSPRTGRASVAAATEKSVASRPSDCSSRLFSRMRLLRSRS